MTRKMTRKWMAVMGVGFLSVQVSSEETLVLQSQKEKASYRFWAAMGRNLKRQEIDLDVDVLVRGGGWALGRDAPRGRTRSSCRHGRISGQSEAKTGGCEGAGGGQQEVGGNFVREDRQFGLSLWWRELFMDSLFHNTQDTMSFLCVALHYCFSRPISAVSDGYLNG